MDDSMRLRKVLRGRIQRQGRMDGTIWLWKVLRGLILDTVDIFGEPKKSLQDTKQ